MIISHLSDHYTNIKPNGALMYSINIVKYIIPQVKTTRNWITINTHQCMDHSIFFVHSNVNIEYNYEFLKPYKDLVLVCSQKSTMYKMRKYGRAIYLPLSIDVDYVQKFARTKCKDCCYAARKNKIHSDKLKQLQNVDYICDRTHDGMLEELSKYKKVYAVGLTALEAKALGCQILPYDSRFPDPSVWVVRDAKNMGKILQEKLDKIDNK